jgi:hypothetical protein
MRGVLGDEPSIARVEAGEPEQAPMATISGTVIVVRIKAGPCVANAHREVVSSSAVGKSCPREDLDLVG